MRRSVVVRGVRDKIFNVIASIVASSLRAGHNIKMYTYILLYVHAKYAFRTRAVQMFVVLRRAAAAAATSLASHVLKKIYKC